jgi:stearoyl-CoA desaturase (delta-9 desaturase)
MPMLTHLRPQHAFPHDFRAGPNLLDWDPSKWIITVLHKLGLATGLRKARKEDISTARAWMQSHHHEPFPSTWASEEEDESESLDSDGSRVEVKWNIEDLTRNARERNCLLVIDGFVVDVSSYVGEHVRVFSSALVEPPGV